jgi:hypothetical protein
MGKHWETPCPKRKDKKHCDCWYDGETCCACGEKHSKETIALMKRDEGSAPSGKAKGER